MALVVFSGKPKAALVTVALGMALAYSFVPAAADTLTWNVAGGGKRSDTVNWSSAGTHTVPQSGDMIIISKLPGGQACENGIVGCACDRFMRYN